MPDPMAIHVDHATVERHVQQAEHDQLPPDAIEVGNPGATELEKELFCLLQAPEVEAYHSKVVEYLTRIHVLPAGCTCHRLEKFSERPFGIDQATDCSRYFFVNSSIGSDQLLFFRYKKSHFVVAF